MSILSTNQRLIKVGQDYSAGDNIDIQDHIISGKDWSNDIELASANLSGWVTSEFVPLSSFNELKQSYDALSSLVAANSGNW